MSRFPFSPYPSGWYRVADRRNLRPNSVSPLQCLGRDLVLFRGGGDGVSVLDAHCPHLGAHLGIGGRVEDGTIVCPFHAWRFDAKGVCVHVPGARCAPAKAKLRSWPVAVSGGSVMLWFDPADRPPLWPAPVLPELEDPEWTAARPGRTRIVRTHVQELCENGMDLAHFTAIHGHQIAGVDSEGVRIEGPVLQHAMRNVFAQRIGKSTAWLGASARRVGWLSFTCYGLGTMAVRADVPGRFPVSFLTLLHLLPLDGERVRVDVAQAIKRCGPLTPVLRAIAAREAERAVDDDTAILEHKAYLPRPILSEADGPVMQFRKWAAQFHAASPDHGALLNAAD